MISTEIPVPHHKHVQLPRPDQGDWGRNELAILGAPCGVIRELARQLIAALATHWKVAYLDADHAGEAGSGDPLIEAGAAAVVTNKIHYQQLHCAGAAPDFFQKRAWLNEQDLVLINGNHFPGKKQIVLIDPAKPVEKKMEKLTNVQLVLLKTAATPIPDAVAAHLAAAGGIPVLPLQDTEAIVAFVRQLLQDQVPPLNGLVLTGGKSQRMGMDKALIAYHGKPQKEHTYSLLSPLCRQVFISVQAQDAADLKGVNLKDRFTGIGPMGGILTALQSHPDAAWLVVACDLPYLTEKTLQYLVQHRNPSKMATAFYEPDGTFPEPLITIWEPRSYAVLLQALGQGYSCPRKVLINTDTALLQAPDPKELTNVNDPAACRVAKADLQTAL